MEHKIAITKSGELSILEKADSIALETCSAEEKLENLSKYFVDCLGKMPDSDSLHIELLKIYLQLAISSNKNHEYTNDILAAKCYMMQKNERIRLEWQNGTIATEVLWLIKELPDFGGEENKEYLLTVLETAGESIHDQEHPRLKIEVYRKWLEVYKKLDHKDEDHTDTYKFIKKRKKVLEEAVHTVENGMPEYIITDSGSLKCDPVQFTKRWEEIIDEVEYKVWEELKEKPRTLGFCYIHWYVKSEVLKRDYHIDWRSPSMMNPGVMFD